MLKTATLLASIMLASAALAEEGDVGGKYTVLGKNVSGTEYKGTAEITVTSENTCRIQWSTGEDGSGASEGICMRNGTAFAAGYVLGESVGLIVYQINPDRSMAGLWTIADQDGVGEEVLTPAE